MTTADIPRGRHSWYRDSVKPVTAHFVVDCARKRTNEVSFSRKHDILRRLPFLFGVTRRYREEKTYIITVREPTLPAGETTEIRDDADASRTHQPQRAPGHVDGA
jgi:hypothetical protein